MYSIGDVSLLDIMSVVMLEIFIQRTVSGEGMFVLVIVQCSNYRMLQKIFVRFLDKFSVGSLQNLW